MIHLLSQSRLFSWVLYKQCRDKHLSLPEVQGFSPGNTLFTAQLESSWIMQEVINSTPIFSGGWTAITLGRCFPTERSVSWESGLLDCNTNSQRSNGLRSNSDPKQTQGLHPTCIWLIKSKPFGYRISKPQVRKWLLVYPLGISLTSGELYTEQETSVIFYTTFSCVKMSEIEDPHIFKTYKILIKT